MRDVYRRTDVTRIHALVCLPLALLATAACALAGASWADWPMLLGAFAGGTASIGGIFGLGIRRYGRHPQDRLAAVDAVWPRVLRRLLLASAALVAFLLVLGTDGVLTWWLLPTFYASLGVGGVLGWAGLVLWERRHPGAIAVTDYDWWKNDAYVWREDASATGAAA